MNVNVCRLNVDGLAEFMQWLTASAGASPPERILTDEKFSEPIEQQFEIELSKSFANTFLLGKYLNEEVFRDVRDPRSLYEDGAMWAWISLAMIDSLVSKKDRGAKKKGSTLALIHYVQSSPYASKRHAYKLIARSAWWMAKVHGDAAAFVLGSPDSPWGEIAEAVIGRQQLASHSGFISLASRLYLTPDGMVKKGAAGKRTKENRVNPKSKSGLGSMRRLALTLNQFGRTYNTRAIQPDAMLSLLPKEYQRWST